MILVGRDSTGVIIYMQTGDNGTVAISHVTWSGFAQTFPYLDFIICPHNVNVWKPYSSTQHREHAQRAGLIFTEVTTHKSVVWGLVWSVAITEICQD